MKTEKFETVKTEQSINKCLEYSENPEKLKELLTSLDVQIKFTGIKKYFQDDKEERLTGIFKIERANTKTGAPAALISSIEFEFGFSINDTEIFIEPKNNEWYRGKFYDRFWELKNKQKRDKQEFMNDLLYDCLACCGSDYFCPIDFDDFCSEFGYDNDSIKAKKTWEACLKQSSKLQRIFNEDEISWLPR